jgi:histone H3/H4
MVDCKDIKICSQELLKIIKSEKKVKEEQKIIKLLSEYIERLIFNITALASLLCLKIGIKKIMDEHVKFILHYIDKYCKTKQKNKMKGGAFNTAQFFGVDETHRYKIENEGTDIMNIDFNNNIARPELGLMSGGKVVCNKLNRIIKMKVRQVFKHFNVKIKSSSLDVIMRKFNDVLNDVTDKIKNSRGDTINYNIVKKVIYKGNIMKK